MAITTFKAKVVSTDDPNKYISYSRDFTVKFQTNELNSIKERLRYKRPLLLK